MGNDAYTTNPFSREQWSRPRDVARWEGGDAVAAADSFDFPMAAQAPAPRRRLSVAPAPEQSASRSGYDNLPLRQREVATVSSALRVVPLVAAVGLAVFLLCLVVGGVQGCLADQEGPDAVTSAPLPVVTAGADALPTSTPKEQWCKGEMPYLYQIDPAWANEPYAGDTVGTSGCGPTSLAMVYVALTGRTDYDPPTMARFSEENGFVEEGLTAWRLMTEGAALLGLSSREVPASVDSLKAELAEGHPVICTVGPGDFTETGHFIVVSGVAEDGNLIVHDPNSAENSAKTWDAQRVLDQCRNLWAFERA